ncbi:MAG TPA: hypothetical protein VH108_12695 [Gaiellaceae bacterium]|nr:hypothetical protein [Gaiellaceae bacterium]
MKISTDGKILIIGKLNFAQDHVSISGRLYADLSHVSSGNVTVLFLADIPDQIQLLTIYGKLKMGFRNSTGQEVQFDVVAPPSTGGSTIAPTAAVADPSPVNGSIVLTRLTTPSTQSTIDITYQTAPGANLDYQWILDHYSSLQVSGAGVNDATLVPTGVKAVSAVTTAGGIAYGTLDLDTVNHRVTRTVNSVTDVIVSLTDLPGSTDAQLLLAAIQKVGTTRFRYTLPTPTWKLGEVVVTFADDALKNADSTDAAGNVTTGTKSDPFALTFTVEGASARLTDPGLNGSIDVNVINNRNWIDVTFTPPSGMLINGGSITDAAPEFALSGPGVGSIVLDASRAPSLVSTDSTTKAATYRYWLIGQFVTGDVTLTYLPNSWSVSFSTTSPTLDSLSLGGTQFLVVIFPNVNSGRTIIDSSIADAVDSTHPQEIAIFTVTTGWTVTVDDTIVPVKIGTNTWQYTVHVTGPATSTAASIDVQYEFKTGTWQDSPDGTATGAADVTFTEDPTSSAADNFNNPTKSPQVRQTLATALTGATNIVLTLPTSVASGVPAGYSVDPSTVTNAIFVDDNTTLDGIQLHTSSGNWTITLDDSAAPQQIGSSNQWQFAIIITQPGSGASSSATIAPVLQNTLPDAALGYFAPASATEATQPGATQTYASGSDALSNTHTFLDVRFVGTPGYTADSRTILDAGNEFAFGGFGGSGVGFWGGNGKVLQVGDDVYRFMLTGDFRPGEVDLNFIQNTWDQYSGRGPPTASTPAPGPGFNAQFSLSFNVVGATADLVRTIPATATAPETVVALGGATIGQDVINAIGYVEVRFHATSGNSIDATTINGGELELRDAAGSLVTLGAPQRVGTTDIYRYSFTGQLVTGKYTATFVAGSFSDTSGAQNLVETEFFTVVVATANLADPRPNQQLDTGLLNDRGWIDVTFGSNGGQAVNPDTITDSGAEFTLVASGDTIVVDGAAVLVDAATSKYRYFFTGYKSGGSLAISFVSGSWDDTTGAHVTNTATATYESLSLLANRTYIDVTLNPTAGSQADLTTVNGDEITLSGSGVGNVVAVSNGVTQIGTTNTFRYLFTGDFAPGTVNVAFNANSWKDTAGNSGVASSNSFTVIKQAQSFFIEINGGLMLHAPFVDEALVELKADVTLEIDTARNVFTLTFSGQLKLIKLGTVGATAGRFVLDMSNTLSSGPQLWGVASLETNFSALEPYGIFLFAKGFLEINTTEQTHVETLSLPGVGTGGADLVKTFTLRPQSFALELVGQLRVRPPGTTTDLIRLQGGFFLSIDPAKIQIYATAELSFGVGDAQLTYGQATGLIIVRTGTDGATPGVAGMLTVGSSAGLGIPGIGSLFSISGTVSVMFNTTKQDQVFQIPDDFLPLLHPGDPTSITIFKSAPGLDGLRNPNSPPGGEIYVSATINAQISIGGVITLNGFIQIQVGVDSSGNVRLQIVGAVGTQIAFLGSLSGQLNLTVTLGPNPGVVGRVFLTLQSSSIPGIELGGEFLLEINTYSTDQTIQTFKTKTVTQPSGHVAFDGFERNAAGNLVVTTQTITVHGGFQLLMAGHLVIASTLRIDAEVLFRLELTGANAGIELVVNGSMNLAPIGNVALIDSGFRINAQGLVARVQLQLDAHFGENIGLKFSLGALLSLNTTGRTQTLGSSTVDPGFRLHIEGDIEFLGFMKGSGFVDISVSPTGFQLLFGVDFELGGLTFSADGGAAVVGGLHPGFAMKLNVHVVADALVFSIDASGTIQINTSDAPLIGIAANSFLLDVNGKIEILKVLKFDAGLKIVVLGSHWSFNAHADVDFFGIVQLSGSIFLDDLGNFDVQLSGGMTLGSSSFGLIGTFHFRIRSQATPGVFGNTYDFELSGGARVEARVFGITLAGVGLDFSFSAHGSGRTKIELSVTVSIDLGLFSISKTAHFTIGYLELPKQVYLAAEQSDIHQWDSTNGGDLYLNVGNRVTQDGDRNIGDGEPNESYLIEQLTGTATDATIKVTAFGRSNIFPHVHSIHGDFGAGNDYVLIADSVKLPVYIDGGADDDVIIYRGSNPASTLNGGSGDDYVEASGPAAIAIDAGTGDDVVQHTGAGVATINGNDGSDLIFGGPSGTDVISGGAGDDTINGPAASIHGDGGNDTINITLDTNTPIALDGGTGTDTLNTFLRPQNDTVDVAKVSTGNLTLTLNGTPYTLFGFENLHIDGRGGADAFVVHDLESSGLATFQIDFGHQFLVNGTTTQAVTVAGKTYNRVVPNVIESLDGAADSLYIYGSDTTDDQFILSATGANAQTGKYTQLAVARSRINSNGTVTPLYSITVTQSVFGEGDAITVDAGGGNDVLDASGLGIASSAQGIQQTNQIAVTLIGGAGNDRLIGTPFNDVLNSGDGNDVVTGGEGLDTFIDSGGIDTLIESFDTDIGLFDSTLVEGHILGDGKAQVITMMDGVTASPEVQRIQHQATGGSFKLIYGTPSPATTTAAIAFDASGATVMSALVAIGAPVASVVAAPHTVNGVTTYTWTVTFSNHADQPILQADSSSLTAPAGVSTAVVVNTTQPAVADADAVAEVQRITHSGAGGTFAIYLDSNPSIRAVVPWNVTAAALQTALNTTLGLHTTVALRPSDSTTWEITFRNAAGDGIAMPQLRVDDTNLTPGGTIHDSPTQAELQATFNEDNPTMRLQDTGDRYAAGATVENLKGIFENAVINGGEARNIIVVGDGDGKISVGGAVVNVTPWSGTATLDNKGESNPVGQTGGLNELYIVNLGGSKGGTRISVVDTGGTSGSDEIIVNGTDAPDTVTLDATGSNLTRTGYVTFGDLATPSSTDVVSFIAVEYVSVNTFGGDDNVLSNDTAAVTLINLGGGDDTLTVGTVPLKPDPGNRTLEFPDGVPVVDTDNLTNGNSNPMYAMGEANNDDFEVNYNRASLFLHGGAGNDRFELKTFLVLREDQANPQAITNLTTVFGGEGSNRYDYLQDGPVLINGGPGDDTLVFVGTPIGDTFIITSNVIAGAGRIANFRGIESVEVDGGGGNDQFWVLSTSEDFVLTINGGSGDDVINLGGDPPPLLFDPPPVSYTPPKIIVQQPPTLSFVTTNLNYGDWTFDFDLGFWNSLISTFFGVTSFLDQAVAAVQATIQGWFNSWSQNVPNFQNPTMAYDGISASAITTSTFFGLITSTEIRIVVNNLRVSYQRGVLTTSTPVEIQPPTVTVDPPPFLFKVPAKSTVEGIAGRVIIDGGSAIETAGDTIVVHNGAGLANAGLLTNRYLPRYEQVGEDPATGAPIYVLQTSDGTPTGSPIEDRYVSLEGIGLNIPLDGFVGPDGHSLNFGILIKNVEGMDLRLADEPNAGSPAATRSDDFTVALLEQRGSATKNDIRTGLLDGTSADHMNLQLVLGAGDDNVTLKQTTGNVTILGGAGSDTVTISDNQTLSHIGGDVRFDGAAHIDEVSSQVATIGDLGLGSNPVFPLVYAHTAGAIAGHPILSYTDANGHVINYQSPPDLEPIVFAGSGGVRVYSVALRANGTIIQDYVQELGVPEVDPVTHGPVYIDANGQRTLVPADANGFPNTRSYVASNDPSAQLLYVSPTGSTPVPSSVMVVNTAGADITVYARPVGTPDWSTVVVEVSNDLSSWTSTSAVTTPVNVPGDNFPSTVYMHSYNVNGTAGSTWKYVRVRSTNAFQLDAIGIIPGHGGPQTSSTATAFPTAVQSSSLSNAVVPGAAGAPNGTYVDLGGQNIVFKSTGTDTPALVQVNRVTDVPLTRSVDVHTSFAGGNDQLIVDGSLDGGSDGTLDTVPVPFDHIASDGSIQFNGGTVTQNLTLLSGQTTATLSQPAADPTLLTVIAKRQLAIGGAFGYTRSGNTVILGSSVALGPNVVVQLRYDTALGVRTQTYSGNAAQTLTLVDTPNGSLFTVTVFEVLPFTVNGSTLTVASASVDRTLVVNFPASAKYYFGGEQIFSAATDQTGRVILTPVNHAAGDTAYDPYSTSAVALRDPFQNTIQLTSNDPLVAFNGDPVLHYAGETVTYLGGEPVLDESGRVVLNADGSIFTHAAGQARIQDRGDDAYVADSKLFPYATSLDLLSGSLIRNPLASLVSPAGWHLDLTRDKVVAVIVHSQQALFALYGGTDFTLGGTGNATLSFTAAGLAKLAGLTSVQLEVTFALRAFHLSGDQQTWTGTEAVAVGDPVVTGSGNTWTVVTDKDGHPVLYTAATILDSHNHPILHKRGEQKFSVAGNTVTPLTYDGQTLIAKQYLGNEAATYFGGEQVYYSATDPVTTAADVRNVHRLTIGATVITYTDSSFPVGVGAGTLPSATTPMALTVHLDAGDNTFTIASTQEGTTLLTTGAGSDRVAIRSTSGATTVQTGAGNDTVDVGSEAGLWSEGFIDVNGRTNFIQAALTIDGGGDSGDQLNVDDTGSSAGKTGTLTSSTLTGLGMGGTVTYTTFSDLNVNLGSGDDTFTILSTHAGTTKVEGRGGNDTINVRTITGNTTVIGDGSTTTISYDGNIVSTGIGDDLIQVGSNAGVGNRNFEGTLSGIVGHLTIDGAVQNDVDRLNVDDSGDPVARTGRLDGTTVTGLGLGSGITYTRFEALQVNLGTQNDTFHIASTHTGTTRVSGGPGSDTITVQQVLGGTQIEGDDPVVAPAETFTADGWTDIHTHRVLDGVTPITVTVNGVTKTRGVDYTFAYGDDTIHFLSAVTGTVVVTYGGSPSAFARTTTSGGGGQDHVYVNVSGLDSGGHPIETHVNGIGAYLAIDGQLQSDLTTVFLAGTPFSAPYPISTIDVHDSGLPTDANMLTIYGTDDELISDNFLVRQNFVALLPLSATQTAERVNYDFTLNRGVQIFGRKGDDIFSLDDTSTIFTIDGGQGDDRFQIGQMFQAPRVPGGSDPTIPLDRADDAFPTVHTTRGYLSNGISFDTTIDGGQGDDVFTVFHNGANLILNGDSGNDSFSVRAFALFGSTAIDPNQKTTNVFGGLGNDFVEYTLNAPVSIDGGAGTDTVHIIGTEFSDTFAITNQGVYGAGLFVQFVGIEVLNVDGLEGNDRFVVYSTNSFLSTNLYGGDGSDTFEVGGSNDGLPVSVESNDLRGYSGLILSSVESVDPNYQNVVVDGVSANVIDNEAAGVIVTPLGLMRVTEGSTQYAQYTVQLSKAPASGNVYITVSPTELTEQDLQNGALGLALVDPVTGHLVPSLVLTFNAANWNVPQVVQVAALADNAPEGAQKQVSEFFTPAAGTTTLTLQHAPASIEYVKVNGAKIRLSQAILNGNALTLPATPANATVEVAYILFDGALSTAPIRESVRADSSPEFVGAKIPLMVVTVVDGSTAGNSVGVVTTPSAATIAAGGTPTVTEGGAGDTYSVQLSSMPTASVTVTVTSDGQVLLNGLTTWTHTFTSLDWNVAQVITLSALDDSAPEGFRTSSLHTTVSSPITTDGPGRFDGTSVPDIQVRVVDNDTGGVLIQQSGGSTDVIEGSSAGDTLSVVLTKQPGTGNDIHVTLSASPTLFGTQLTTATSAKTVHFWNGTAFVDSITLTFTHDTWNLPQTVTVFAVDDAIVNGDGIQVFAPNARSLDQIRGPLNIQGGDDATADTSIPTPVLFAHETQGGPFVPPLNPNLISDETQQTDVLQVLNSDSLANDTGILTGTGITGLGMGSGITYNDIELLRLDLGRSDDSLRIDSTHGGITIVNAGPGNDRINVRTVAGPTTINGEDGNDIIDVGTNFTGVWPDSWNHAVSTPAGTLAQIRSYLRVDGGLGTDTLNVDDTSDTTSDVAILTGSTIDGIDLGSSPVQTVTIRHASGGTFALVVGGLATTALSLAATSAQVKAALLALHVAHVTDVVVNRAGNTFTIGFLGDELLSPTAVAITVDTSQLVSDGSTPTAGVTSWATSLAQTLDVRGSGTYHVTVGAGSIGFDVTAAMSSTDFFTALKAAIRAVDPTLLSAEAAQFPAGDWGPGVKDILVDKVGSSFFVTYQGLLRGTVADAFALHIAPNSTVTPTSGGAATVTLNAVGGTFTLTSGGARTYALAYDATAGAIAAALNALLGTGVVGVVRNGSTLSITGLGTASLTVDDANLDNPLAVATRRSGIGYKNIEVLNVDLGSGDDVVNVQGTSAITNVFGHNGNERYYVSSLANETLASAQTTDLLLGNLDDLLGNLNIDAGAGRHRLFVSDEAAVVGDPNVSITDHPLATTRLPLTEIEISGLAPAAIDYQAATNGTFVDGITVWSGYGNDTFSVDGTHRRATVNEITTLNTGLGDDNVTVNLDGNDGSFVLNTQGPYNQFLSLSDKDVVNGAGSSLPLVVFGGQDDDQITTGTGNDIVVGDRGRVLYFDPTLPAPGAGLTEAQLEALAKIVLGHGGPGDKTDGIARLVGYVTSVDTTVGGNDTITTGLGNDVMLGGVDADTVNAGEGNNVVLGDNGFVDYAVTDTNPATLDRVFSIDPATGGNDTITVGNGDDIAVGGNDGQLVTETPGPAPGTWTSHVALTATKGDTITAGNGRKLVFGDNGQITRAASGTSLFGALPITLGLVTTIQPALGGNDTVTTGTGADIVLGGVGNDTITAGDGDNIVLGDNGYVDYTAAERSYSVTSAGDDLNPATIDRISTTDSTLGGSDTITTGLGYDLIFGGTAGDTINSGAGNDLVFGDHGRLLANAGGGINARALPMATAVDPFTFTSIDTQASDLGGNDVIHAGAGDDIVLGGQGVDWIWGEAGDDDIIGGHNVQGGNDQGDVIDGGTGNDAIAGDNAVILRRGDNQSPRFRSFGGAMYDASGNVVGGITSGAAQLSPDSVAGRDILILDHSAAIESSQPLLFGNDYIAGNAGDDVIFGELGNDTIQGDGSIDSFFTGSPVGASRTSTGPNDPLGPLTITPSFDAATDGNDYVEGGGGNDVIFGNQGEDDLIGGSSKLFGLGTKAQRPDGSDYIFGGSGTAISLDNPGGSNGGDSDAILGDNGDIYRIVTAAGVYAKYTYDNYAGRKIVVRAIELLDYTPGGPDYNGSADGIHATGSGGTPDIGAADEIHGENGDDFIYGQVGNDRIFGDGQNDTIVGGYGADWISGGTGDDGILGDDGRILASRVGQTEPLNGVTVVPVQNVEIKTQGSTQDVMTFVTGTLLYAADLTPDNLDPTNAVPSTNMPRPLDANDVIYGGLGNDSIHGGAGDDAISGAEALAVSYTNNYNQDGTLQAAFLKSDFNHPYNPGNVLGYSPTKTYQAQYDPNDPLREVKLTATGALWKSGTGFDWLLNFNATDGPLDAFWAAPNARVATDGDDIIFGDLGNDWAVGGTGRDTMWGGWGNDYLNADDVLTSNGGLNTANDTNASYEDFAYGGAGLDVLIGSTGGDRLVDWNGEFNTYVLWFNPFGSGTVTRLPAPDLEQLLLDFAKSQGADQTLAAAHGGTTARDGEPWGELGLVDKADAAWQDQNAGPRDPQGSNGGTRDVLRSSGTKPIGAGTVATASVAPSGAAGPATSASLAAAPAGNNGWYDVGGTAAFSYSGSGVTTATLDGNAISSAPLDLTTLVAGGHTIVVRGVDTAGNVTIQTISFEVHATLTGLGAALDAGAAKGLITKAEQTTLAGLLQQAIKGNAKRQLPAFISEVRLQSGGAIAAGYAALLQDWANDLLARL